VEGIVLDPASPYRGADLPRAQRFTRVLWALGVAIVFAVVPFYPPTALIGDTGWWVLAGYVPVVVATFALASRKSVGFRGLLVVTYVGLVAITTLQVLAAPEAPYLVIDLLLVCCVALTHPLQIAMPYAVTMAATRVGCAALDHGDPKGAFVHATMEAVIWTVLAAVLCGVMLQVREQRLELRDERSIDPLTGLLNRLAFDEQLDTQIAAHRGSGRPLSLIVADVNGFKQLNDGHGHLEGDRQLKAIAASISSAVRADDVCFRWGGDEFAVLLPEAGGDAAARVGERMAEIVALTCAQPEPLTIAVGHATLAGDDDADSLTARADAMLFERKRALSLLASLA
jgi:diguanylate cyclase (GGDEF)-like protein